MKSKTVYVLGAGASKDVGAPVLADFSNQDYLNTLIPRLKKLKIEPNEFLKVSNFVVNYIQDGYASNIEDLLNISYAAEYLDITFGTPYAKKQDKIFPEVLRKDIEWFITAVLFASIKKKNIDFYKKFITEILGPNDSLISFNYDLIFENAIHKTDFDINYGFNDGWESEPDKKELLLLKLHGSIDWLWCEHCGLTIDYNKNVALDIQEGKSKCLECDRKNKITSMIVPPIFNKEQYFAKMSKNKRNLTDVWQRAYAELTDAKKIVFIGYSLPIADTYAHSLFKIAISLNSNKKLNIEIINPDKDLFKKYCEILNYNNIHQNPIYFEDYVNSLH